MTSQTDTAQARRTQIAALLGAYPAIAPGELAHLQRWFRNEASALEVGLIASEPSIARGYAAFRKDHLDRIRPREALVMLSVALAYCAMIGWMMLHGMR